MKYKTYYFGDNINIIIDNDVCDILRMTVSGSYDNLSLLFLSHITSPIKLININDIDILCDGLYCINFTRSTVYAKDNIIYKFLMVLFDTDNGCGNNALILNEKSNIHIYFSSGCKLCVDIKQGNIYCI